jgi:hypothetical protein
MISSIFIDFQLFYFLAIIIPDNITVIILKITLIANK